METNTTWGGLRAGQHMAMVLSICVTVFLEIGTYWIFTFLIIECQCRRWCMLYLERSGTVEVNVVDVGVAHLTVCQRITHN